MTKRETASLLTRSQALVKRRFFALFFIVGLFITILGGGLLHVYSNASKYRLQPSFSGFGVARNDTVSPYQFLVGVSIEPTELWFQYSFFCSRNGTCNFLFAFPFYIVNKLSATDNMSFEATSYGSAVWLRHQVDTTDSHDIYGNFGIKDTFRTGSRGSYMFLLPFGLGIRPEVVRSLQKNLSVTFHSPDVDVDLSFAIPSRYRIVQTFPQMESGPYVWTPIQNRTMTGARWEFEGRLSESVTIYCENSDEIFLYEILLFFGGLVFGIGTQIMVRTFYDYAKEKVQPPVKPWT